MEEDEDDFYGGRAGGQFGETYEDDDAKVEQIQPDDMDVAEDEDDEDEDDVQFTLEKPEAAKSEPTSKTQTNTTAKAAVKIEPSAGRQSSPKAAQQTIAPKQESAPTSNIKAELLHNGKEGKDYPEIRASKVDLIDDPIWPADGKKITELDIDADLVEHSKPWRLPGTDITDFFNYGFDEYTWTQYCARQRDLASQIAGLKDEDAKMKNMLGGMPGEAMPDMAQMMQMMMGGGMHADPKMDFGQMMMGMNMPPVPPMPGVPPGFPVPLNSNSPLPPNGQGFQAPSTQGQLGFNGAGMNGEGFNTQQPGMVQQDQGQSGGGGPRSRNRRGRGYY